MANIKEVEIEARLPWDWAGDLKQEDGALFASMFLNSVYGLRIEQSDNGYVEPNEHGGMTRMVIVRITGEEGCAWPLLDRVVKALNECSQWAQVNRARARDVQFDTGRWEKIEYEGDEEAS